MTVLSALAKLARLMSPDLPQRIEPARLADAESHLQGKLNTDAMQRLKDLILDPSGPVELDLAFGRDERGVIRITGDYRVNVSLRCQRCLELMEMTLSNPFNIGLVPPDGSGDRISGEFEPIIMEGSAIELLTLVEDELLLALPMSAVHALEDCPAAEDVRERAPKKPNPFEVLKKIKSQ